MDTSEIITIILSGLAFAFSIFTYFFHDFKLKKQELRLNEISLREAKEGEENRRKAKISGCIVYYGSGSNDLLITNNGEADARNVRIEVLESSDNGCLWNDKERFIQQLTPGNTYKFHFNTISGASKVIHFRYSWEDDFSSSNEAQEFLQRK